MPCYEVRTMSVEFKAENRQLLDAAIKATGLLVNSQTSNRITRAYGKVVIKLDEGTAEVREGEQNLLNKIKQAYSKECIKAACKKVQWAVKFEGQGTKATVTKMKW